MSDDRFFEQIASILGGVRGGPSNLDRGIAASGSSLFKYIKSKLFSLAEFNSTWSSTLNNIFSKSALLTDLSSLGSGKWNDIFTKSSLLIDLNSLGSNKWIDIFSLDTLNTAWSTTWNKISSFTENMTSLTYSVIKSKYQEIRQDVADDALSTLNNLLVKWRS